MLTVRCCGQFGGPLQVAVPQCKLDGADVAMTVQRTLGDNGYATIAAGKWHVSPGGAALWDDYPAVIGLVNGTGFTAPAAMYVIRQR